MCASDRRFAFFNNFFVFRVSGRLWHEKLKSCTCFQSLFFFLSVLYDFLNSEWWLRCFVWGQLVMRVWHFEGQRFPGEHSLPIDVLSLTETCSMVHIQEVQMFRLVCIVPFFYNKGQLQTEIVSLKRLPTALGGNRITFLFFPFFNPIPQEIEKTLIDTFSTKYSIINIKIVYYEGSQWPKYSPFVSFLRFAWALGRSFVLHGTCFCFCSRALTGHSICLYSFLMNL